MEKHRINPPAPGKAGAQPLPPPLARGPTSGAGGGRAAAPQPFVLQEHVQGVLLALPQPVGISRPRVIQLLPGARGEGGVVVREAGGGGTVVLREK